MKHTKFIFLLVLVGAVSFLIAQAVQRRSTLDTQNRVLLQISELPIPPKRIPMQIRYEEMLSSGIGAKPMLSTQRLLSISADGSVSTINYQYTNDGRMYFTHRRLELSGGVSADIMDTLRSVTAYKAKEPEIEDKKRALYQWRPEDRCAIAYDGLRKRAESVRTEHFLGYEVLVFEKSDPSTRWSNWVAPALGCLELRQFVEFADDKGEFTQTSDLRAIEISLDPPPQQVFAIPTGYDHLTPSETLKRESEFRGTPVSKDELQRLQKFDEQYRQGRYIPQ